MVEIIHVKFQTLNPSIKQIADIQSLLKILDYTIWLLKKLQGLTLVNFGLI